MRTRIQHLRPLSTALISVCVLAVLILPPPSAHAAALAGVDWGANATSFRGHNGARYEYVCPAGGHAGSLWGTDTYTDDSSVCTAAVHTGAMTTDGGGIVTIEIRPGLATYTGSTRNGVT